LDFQESIIVRNAAGEFEVILSCIHNYFTTSSCQMARCGIISRELITGFFFRNKIRKMGEKKRLAIA
jgi:hypothetical protein